MCVGSHFNPSIGEAKTGRPLIQGQPGLCSKTSNKTVYQIFAARATDFFLFLVSLCSSGCPGIYSVDVDQAGLKLTEFTCLMSAGIKVVFHHCPARLFFLRYSY